ncbi:WxL domain-containing protein [Candidatus Enterococcus avicola]
MKKMFKTLLATTLLATSTLGAKSAFAANPEPGTAETPVTADLELKDAGTVTPPINPTDPDNPGEDITPITGHFGIAYLPKPLNATSKLEATGEQKIALSNGVGVDKFNVGVRDTLRKMNKWELSVQLAWAGANASYMNGTTITGENGVATENINGNLQALKDGEVTTNAASLTISNTPTVVLETVDGKQTNGTYNYGFEKASLVIPATEKVPSGSYTGTVTWNLAVTPATP